jgi:hypothetical protein
VLCAHLDRDYAHHADECTSAAKTKCRGCKQFGHIKPMCLNS